VHLSVLPFLAIVFLVALSGAVFMPGAWYASLKKPSWTPPDWLFAPAWTILYLMIAIAGWLVWRAEGIGPALIIWGLNLFFNAL
jgi:benzodiazapine receptor